MIGCGPPARTGPRSRNLRAKVLATEAVSLTPCGACLLHPLRSAATCYGPLRHSTATGAGTPSSGRRRDAQQRPLLRRFRFQIATHSAQVSTGGSCENSPRTTIGSPQYATTIEPAGCAGGG